jgi:type IV secretory pathway VirB10-like protein
MNNDISDDRQHTGMPRRRRALAFLHVCLVACLASGCIRTHARTTPNAPPLDVPLPPPRLVEAAETPPPEPLTLPAEPVRSTLPRPRTPPAPAQQTESTKPPEPPKAPEEPPKEPKPPVATTLRTTPTQQEGELEKRTRGLLLEATSNLNRIDYGRLTADAKGQYDSAKGFVRQAEDALRTQNLVFASYLADKAATLAAQLRGK